VKSADEEVRSYLKELDRNLSPLPQRRRKEVVQEISSHIAESRHELGMDHPIADVLDRVGDPQVIAWEAMQGEPTASHRSRGLEIAAIIFLLPGSLLLPIIGWLVGVVLLWASSIWTTKDKLIATLIVPGGLLFAAFLPLSPAMTCSQIFEDGRLVENTCSGGLGADLWMAVWIISIIGPIAVGIYLGRRLRRTRVLTPQMIS
jgi:uncharacterized membrane protein